MATLSTILFALSLAPAQAAPPKATAAADPAAALAVLGGDAGDDLAGNLRTLMIKMLPTPLYEKHDHWGGKKEVTRGVKWVDDGGVVHPEAVKKEKNDGLWWRIVVTAPDVADHLVFKLRDWNRAEPGRVLFTAFVAFDTDVEYEQQRWAAGLRLASRSIRARARVKLTLRCEATTRIEGLGKTLLPEAVFRLRVLESDFHYDDLVFEHAAGVGGTAAKVLGEAAHASVSQWRPSLERHLIEKANKAIVKAGDTKEVRVGLSRLFEKK